MNARTLKPGWKMVKFGEVVKNANLVERDPKANGIERVVGLEHIDPENLHIRRWNSVEEGTSFTRKFVPGQTLFGKRRAYQRKVGYAKFEGICSGDILTFEPKNEKALLPELLPFICQSEAFFAHALDTSAGSLSPRTSWAALRDFEFPLAPLDEQKRIAEILWATDEAVVSFGKAKESLLQIADTFATDFLNQGWNTKSLGKLLLGIEYGSSKRIAPTGSGTAPILRIPNVIGGRIILDDLAFVDISKPEVDRYRLFGGDVLIVRTNGNPDYVGRTAVVEEIPEDCVYASYLIRLIPNAEILLPKYLHAALSSSLIRRTLRHEIRSSAGNYNLNTKGIKKQVLPLPPPPQQLEFVRHSELFERKIAQIDSHLSLLRGLRLSITNQEIGAAHV